MLERLRRRLGRWFCHRGHWHVEKKCVVCGDEEA